MGQDSLNLRNRRGVDMTPLLPQTPVKSSNLKSVGYDPQSLHLQVTFNSGETYDYFGVPPQAHTAFLSAKSKGTFFDNAIKKRFRHSKRR